MSKALVAWFSAEAGYTSELADKFAKVTEGDKFEIVPDPPYSKADLAYMNPLARCNREQIAKKLVPYAGKVENMADYDTLYIGFPIWYNQAPMVIKTFVKDYDLSGKKLVLFGTSGGSTIGKTGEKLKPFLSDGATIVGGNIFSRDASEADVKAWLETL